MLDNIEWNVYRTVKCLWVDNQGYCVRWTEAILAFVLVTIIIFLLFSSHNEPNTKTK